MQWKFENNIKKVFRFSEKWRAINANNWNITVRICHTIVTNTLQPLHKLTPANNVQTINRYGSHNADNMAVKRVNVYENS